MAKRTKRRLKIDDISLEQSMGIAKVLAMMPAKPTPV